METRRQETMRDRSRHHEGRSNPLGGDARDTETSGRHLETGADTRGGGQSHQGDAGGRHWETGADTRGGGQTHQGDKAKGEEVKGDTRRHEPTPTQEV